MKKSSYRKNKKTAESRTESYVRKQLKLLGWNLAKVGNGGDCYEKQELNEIPKFSDYPLRPEFVLCVNGTPQVVIECKATADQIDEASGEAKGYAKDLELKIAIGVAGNEDDGVIVQNWFWNGEEHDLVKYNDTPLSQILSKKYTEELLLLQKADLDKIDLPEESRFYSEAEYIHGLFHNSNISKNRMGIILADIILAFYSKPEILRENNFDDIQLVNHLAQRKLKEYGKDDLLETFKISHVESTVYTKLKSNLPLIISSLQRLDVLPLLHSEADILGRFFETFLRYANDKKELGIVFTPRHIVDFMCQLIDLDSGHLVLDPCCGTGGFLVGAFSKMKDKLKSKNLVPDEYEKALSGLKNNQIYGIEQEVDGVIYGLACLNMIFRGDGHANVKHDDCFTQKYDFKFDKVLINPPW